MALRHPQPLWDQRCFGEDTQKPIPRFPPPPVAKFTKGSGVDAVMRALQTSAHLVVDAGMGSGKSTRLSVEMVKAGAPLVIQVMPNGKIMDETADYVAANHPDAGVVFVATQDQQVPSAGVACMSSALYCWWSAVWRAADSGPRHWVLADEIHESDYATHVLRILGPNLPFCEKFISASATHGAGEEGFLSSSVGGECVRSTYVEQDPTQWDLYESGKPWSVNAMTGHQLICTDRPEDQREIVAKFNEAGVPAYVATATTPNAEYKAAKKKMLDTSQIQCLVVDHAFRSGGTFLGVNNIIDLARVAEVDMLTKNTWKIKYRRAYYGELMQMSGRGARITGTKCKYWRPVYDCEKALVSLDGPEADMAVIVLRALGYRAPHELKTVPYATGNLPVNYGKILQGREPLRIYNDRLMDTWPNGVIEVGPRPSVVRAFEHARAPSVVTLDTDVASDISGSELDAALAARAASWTMQEAQDQRDNWADTHDVVGAATSAFTQALNGLSAELDRTGFRGPAPVVQMEVGKFYYSPGATAADVVGYSGGFKDVQRRWGDDHSRLLLRGSSSQTRASVVAVSLNAFNTASVDALATTVVVQRASQAVKGGSISPDIVRNWADHIRDVQERAVMVGKKAAEVIMSLSDGSVCPTESWNDAVSARAAELLEELLTAIREQHCDIDEAQAYVSAASQRVIEHGGGIAMHGYGARAPVRGTTGARYYLDVSGGGARGKLASRLLGMGGKELPVNVIMQ